MAELHDLFAVDASNIARFPEAQAPSTLNNGARALEGIVARYFFDTNHSVVATLSSSCIQMTANRTSITLTGTTSNYVADLLMAFTMGSNANLDGATVNINGIGGISLRDNNGLSLSASAIPSGAKCLITKDGTNNYFRLLRPAPPPVVSISDANVLSTATDFYGFTRSQKTTGIAQSSTTDIFRFLDMSGTLLGAFFINGILIVNVIDQANGANNSSYVLYLTTAGDGTTDSHIDVFMSFSGGLASSIVRGTAIVTSFTLANDGAGGQVKVQLNTPASGKTVTTRATFIGQYK